MKQAVQKEQYQFDSEGYLPRIEDETDQDFVMRTARVLFQEGLSQNHPDAVLTQFDEPAPPPITRTEGESDEDYEAKVKAQAEETAANNQAKRDEGFAKIVQEMEAAKEARNQAQEASSA